MRVVAVHNFYSGESPSGEDDAVLHHVNSLREMGHEVELVSSKSLEASHHSLGSLVRTAGRVATGVGANPLEKIHALRPDVVHVHNLFPSWGSQWLRDLQVPFVVTLHNFRTICANGYLLRRGKFCMDCSEKGQHNAVIHKCYRGSSFASVPLAIANSLLPSQRPLLGAASRIVCLSTRARAVFEKAGFDASKLRVIPNSSPDIDSARSPAAGNRRKGWIFAGRLSEEKGLAELLSHWPSSERLEVFGSGPLEIAVRNREADGIFYHGRVSREEVQLEMSHKEGLIFPSLWIENSPLTYIQALSVGTPTVALPENAVADDIGQAGTGQILSNWSSLQSTLNALRTDEGINERCRKRFVEEYAQEVWAARILELYEEVLQCD